MKVRVEFDLSDKYIPFEQTKCENAQELLDTIIYDYQIGMPRINKIHVISPKFDTTISPK